MDILDELATILQEEINKELVTVAKVTAYQSLGWTLVTSDAPVEDIGDWMQKNLHHDWRVFYDKWLFENAIDAVLFRLTWGQ